MLTTVNLREFSRAKRHLQRDLRHCARRNGRGAARRRCDRHRRRHQSRPHGNDRRSGPLSLLAGQSGNLYGDGAGQRLCEANSQPVAVEVGRTVTLNFNLAHVGGVADRRSHRATRRCLSLDNPNTTTTLEAKTIASLPNPGQDLTYIAQFAPGALMNTAGSSNDAKAAGRLRQCRVQRPARNLERLHPRRLRHQRSVAGPEHRPLHQPCHRPRCGGGGDGQHQLLRRRSGPLRRLAGELLHQIGNQPFHGDFYEFWNGSLFNAEDYFLHANDTPGNVANKPRSNVNEFGVSVGGPIRKNKLFFFAHYEGVRIALPLVSQAVVPSPAYQQYVLSQLPLGGTDPITGTALPAEPAEVAFYTVDVRLYRNTAGTPVAVSSCPLDASGALLPARRPAEPLRRQRLRQPAPGVAQQQRQRKSDRGQDRPHHRRATTASGTAFSRTPACRPPTPIRSIRSSTPTRRSRSARWWPATRTSSAPISSTSSIPAQAGTRASSSRTTSRRCCRHSPSCSTAGSSNAPVHHHRRQRQYLSAGPQGDAVADQRQPGLDARQAYTSSSASTRAAST